MKKYISHLIIICIFFTSCNSKKEVYNEEGKLKGSLRFGWITSASFSGEASGMDLFAEKNNLDLKCEPGGPGINSITLVQTGTNDFGTIAADEILVANDRGADFVIIGVINYHSPGGFVSLKNSGIEQPKDFEGKKVGMLPFGSTSMIYEILLKRNGVDRSKITELTISPDLKPFINKSYDVHPVFVYDETVTLDMNNISYNLIEPKDYNVPFIGPCYFCKRSTYEENPELVKAFVYTMIEGWRFAIDNQKEAIKLLKEFSPEIDTVREALVLKKGAPYFDSYEKRPLDTDIVAWKKMVQELIELKEIKNDVKVENVLKLEYVKEYYSNEVNDRKQVDKH